MVLSLPAALENSRGIDCPSMEVRQQLLFSHEIVRVSRALAGERVARTTLPEEEAEERPPEECPPREDPNPEVFAACASRDG